MLRQITRKSIQSIIVIAVLAMSVAVFAKDMDVGAEEGTFWLSPHERWDTSVVAFDSEDTTYDYGLLREDILAVARAQILADNAGKGTFQLHLPFELSPYDRWIASPEEAVTVARADNAEKETFQLHLPFELSPYDRWNTSVVAVDAEDSTYGLSPEEILSMVAFDAEDSTYGDGLLREDMLAVVRAQILADNVNRSMVASDAKKSGYGLLSEQPVNDNECDLC